MSDLTETEQRLADAFDKAIELRGEDWHYPTVGEDHEYRWHGSGDTCLYWQREPGEEPVPACVWGNTFQLIDPELRHRVAENTGIGSVLNLIWPYDVRHTFQRAAEWAQTAQDEGAPYALVKQGFHHILDGGEIPHLYVRGDTALRFRGAR